MSLFAAILQPIARAFATILARVGTRRRGHLRALWHWVGVGISWQNRTFIGVKIHPAKIKNFFVTPFLGIGKIGPRNKIGFGLDTGYRAKTRFLLSKSANLYFILWFPITSTTKAKKFSYGG